MIKGTYLLSAGVLLVCALSALYAWKPVTQNEPAAEYVGLAHINVQTKDIDKSISFYRDAFGFVFVERTEMSRPDGTTKMAWIRLGSCILELSQPAKTDTVVEKARGVIGHFAIEVRNLPQAAADLKNKGFTFDRDVSAPSNLFGGVRVAFISGPSGESIELFEYLNPDRRPK